MTEKRELLEWQASSENRRLECDYVSGDSPGSLPCWGKVEFANRGIPPKQYCQGHKYGLYSSEEHIRNPRLPRDYIRNPEFSHYREPFELSTGIMWRNNEFEFEIVFNEYVKLFDGQTPCKHCIAIRELEYKEKYYSGSVYKVIECLCPRVIVSNPKRKGGYSPAGICLDCVLDATKEINGETLSYTRTIHQDEYGTLIEKKTPYTRSRVRFVVVEDGTGKHELPVPLDTERAKQAVAWTYNMAEDEYDPVLRT